ncbi:hypothetical protein CR513_52208, partial [Mucuna pruriens]
MFTVIIVLPFTLLEILLFMRGLNILKLIAMFETTNQLTNVFTKPLIPHIFQTNLSNLDLIHIHVLTCGGLSQYKQSHINPTNSSVSTIYNDVLKNFNTSKYGRHLKQLS